MTSLLKYSDNLNSIEDYQKRLIKKNIEVLKWRNLVDNFPVGITIINEKEILYTNRSLTQ